MLRKKLGVNKDVFFTGWIKDLESLYSNLDIVILTSLNKGTPVALIESTAAKRPIVSTDVVGVKGLFTNQSVKRIEAHKAMIRYYDQGILIDSNETENMALAIKKLIKNDKERGKMGEWGRKTVYPKYDISRLLNDIYKLYMNLSQQKM